MKAQLIRVSGNAKTGPIPVSTTGRQSCPDACELKTKGCYASYGPSAIHWKKVTEGERGKEWPEFCKDVKALPKGQLWRHNQAGDLPGANNVIDAKALGMLLKANSGKKGFTYTHYPMTSETNRTAVWAANVDGFTINLSANNVAMADNLFDLGIAPVVTILPRDAENVTYTPKGRKVVACPAEKSDRVNCATCALCQDSKRGYIIGFRAHGTAKKHVDLIAKG